MHNTLRGKGICLAALFLIFIASVLPSFQTPVAARRLGPGLESPSTEAIRKTYTDLLQKDGELRKFLSQFLQNDTEQWLTVSVGIVGLQFLFPPKLPRIFLCPRGIILGIFTYRMNGYTIVTKPDDLINMTVVNGTHGVLIKSCFGYSANMRPRIAGIGGGFIAVSKDEPRIIKRSL